MQIQNQTRIKLSLAVQYSSWKKQTEASAALQGLSFHLVHVDYFAYQKAEVQLTERQTRYNIQHLAMLNLKLKADEQESKICELENKFKEVSQWQMQEAKEVNQWKSDEIKLKGIFQSTISDQYWNTIKSLKSTQEMWIQLKTSTLQKESGHLLSQTVQFFHLELEQNETLSALLDRTESIAEQINDFEKNLISPKIVCLKVLAAIMNVERYSVLHQAIFQVPVKDFTIALLKSRFAAEDSRQASINSSIPHFRQGENALNTQIVKARKCSQCPNRLAKNAPDHHFRCRTCQENFNKEDESSEEEISTKKNQKKKKEGEKCHVVLCL